MKERLHLLNRSKLIEKIAMLFDLLFIIGYILVFIKFYGWLNLPEADGGSTLPPPTGTETIGGPFEKPLALTLMSLMAIFLVISVPMLVTAYKSLKSKDMYQYDKWTSANIFVRGIIGLLSMNPISAFIRFYNTFVVLNYAEEYGFVTFVKLTWNKFLNLFKKKEKKEKEKEHLSEDELILRNRIRKQTFLKVAKYMLIYLFLSIIALFVFIPFYWMVLTALKTYDQTVPTAEPSFFLALKDFQWVNIKYVLQQMDFAVYIKNTIYVGVMSTIGTVITTVLAAFAFSRLEFKGRETIFSILLMTMMIPGELYIITNFLTVSRTGFGWIGGEGTNQYFLAMIIPFMTSVFYIFFLRQTFKQIPNTLYQAARVDGCSDFKFLSRIMIPIAGPTIFTITILSVIGSWNAFIWPRLITQMGGQEGKNFWLISVALRDANFTLNNAGDRPMYNLQIAASAIVTIPLLIVFLALRKYIMSGVGRSGTKG